MCGRFNLLPDGQTEALLSKIKPKGSLTYAPDIAPGAMISIIRGLAEPRFLRPRRGNHPSPHVTPMSLKSSQFRRCVTTPSHYGGIVKALDCFDNLVVLLTFAICIAGLVGIAYAILG